MSTILIVDDDAEFRENMTEVLSSAGFVTDMAGTGSEALEKAAVHRYEVILLDLMMPGMTGFAVLSELRRIAPRTKVIMITAFATVDNAVDAIKNGASDYITKPFKVGDLVMSIRRTLEESRFDQRFKKLDLDLTFNSLANPLRRKIMRLISSSINMRLMEITRDLGIEDHTKVVFHLKNLKSSGLLEQREDKTYHLTPEGEKILSCLSTLESYLIL